MFLEDFDGRVLPFDREAAVGYADLFAARGRAGRPTAAVDLMIASIARPARPIAERGTVNQQRRKGLITQTPP